jgi:hypothetical protein
MSVHWQCPKLQSFAQVSQYRKRHGQGHIDRVRQLGKCPLNSKWTLSLGVGLMQRDWQHQFQIPRQ